jgi:hypothetical protein
VTYGHAPCFDSVGEAGHLALLTASTDPDDLECTTPWVPQTAEVPAPATDDYPFVYLRDRSLPSFYLLVMALILVASVAMVRVASGPLRRMAAYLDLFFMGVAFLLLETKNVVQFALLFGTTWLVNALVFTGVLLAVLAAVEAAKRLPRLDHRFLYMGLAASLLVGIVVPPTALLALGPIPRFAAAAGIAFAPIFLANLIFAQRFRESASSTTAFGANLLGAMVGGLLEYAALIVGYKALLVLAGALYAAAFLSGRAHLPSRPPATRTA